MKKRIEKEDGFTEGEVVESWSKKRIGVAAVITFVVLGFLGYNFMNWSRSALQKPDVKVLGEADKRDVKLPSRDDVQEALEKVKVQIEQLTEENITSSQAAIQSIIKNLEVLQGEGKEPVDVFCEAVCKK